MARQAEKVGHGLAAFAAAPPAGDRDVSHIGPCQRAWLSRICASPASGAPNIRRLQRGLTLFAAEVPAFEATRVKDLSIGQIRCDQKDMRRPGRFNYEGLPL